MTDQEKGLGLYPYQPFKQPIAPVPELGQGDICFTFDRKWLPYLIGALNALTVEQTYTGDKERAVREARDFVAMFIERQDDCGETCLNYPTSSPIIGYAPRNPFTQAGEIPDGWIAPPFYAVTEENLATWFVGAKVGDIVSGYLSFPVTTPALGEGFARFRVTVKGMCTVELHLVTIPNGGSLLLTKDDDPLTAYFVDLNRDLVALPPEGENIVIQEITFDTAGEHHIDATFFVQFNDSEVPIGYGGGLRQVVVCGGDEMAFDARQNTTKPCILEKRNDDGQWVQFADLTLCPLPPKTGPVQWRVQDGKTQYSTDGTNYTDYTDGAEGTFGQHEPSFAAGVDKACVAARNITLTLQQQFNGFRDGLAVGSSIIAIMALISAAVLVFVTAGAAIPLVLILASEIFAVGAEGILNNLTSEFWRQFECTVYSNIGSDGLFNASEFAQFHSDVLTYGDAGTMVSMFLDIYGVAGINNMVTSAGITTCDHTPCTTSIFDEMNFIIGQAPAFISKVWTAYHTSTEPTRVYNYGTVAGKWAAGRGYIVDITHNGYSNWTTRVDIRIPISQTVHVSKIEVDVYVDLDASLGAGQMGELSIWSPDGNKFAGKGLFRADFTTQQFTIVWSVTGGWNLVSGWELEIWMLSEVANYTQYHPPFGRVDIQKVRFYE